MASTGPHGELHSLGIRFGPMTKCLTAQKLLRKIGGVWPEPDLPDPLGNSRVKPFKIPTSLKNPLTFWKKSPMGVEGGGRPTAPPPPPPLWIRRLEEVYLRS